MRRESFPRARTLIAGILAFYPAIAFAQVGQMELNGLLRDSMSARDLAGLRAGCATGKAASIRAQIRAAGIDGAPLGAWCVTVLTRAGRDSALGYVRDPQATSPRPSQSFDDGFVAGYLGNSAVPNGAPSMATLLPIADRCLSQSEPNLKLCSAAGQILGTRAATGEVVASG